MFKEAQHSDVHLIEPMLAELDHLHIKGMPDRFTPRTNQERIRVLKDILQRNGFVIFLDKTAFAAVSRLGQDQFRIEYLFVSEHVRRKGIGSALLEEVEKRARGEVFVSVYAFNKDAIEFYDRFFERSSVVYRKRTSTKDSPQRVVSEIARNS